MAVITSSRTVAVAPAVAERVLLDWGRDPAWRTRVRRMTVDPPGPAVVGQRVVERLRFAGLTLTTPTRITHVARAEPAIEALAPCSASPGIARSLTSTAARASRRCSTWSSRGRSDL